MASSSIATATAAFVATTSTRTFSPFISTTTTTRILSPTTTTTTTRTISVATTTTMTAMTPTQYQQAALGFFNGIRFPSTLIAGSSVAAIVSLLQQARNTDGLTKLEIVVLRLYHAVSILQLCLSMTTISMSTSACTLLLLTSKFTNTQYTDMYHFLRGDLNFEFVVTRWAFFSSLSMFLIGVACRILLELDLLKPNKQKTTGWLVVCTLMGVLTGILSNINLTLNCWPNLIGMTKEVLQLITERFMKHRGPLQLLSLASFIGALACLVKLMLQWLQPSSSSSSSSSSFGDTVTDTDSKATTTRAE